MRVTIITVCLNNRLFIEAAIKSVLKQDYPDFEYLIIDGESSDGTVEVIKAFAEIDARVLWSSAPDRGIGHAMNIGLGRATGDIIAFLHADDFYPDKGVVTAVVEKFETTPGTVWVTGGIREVDASGRDIRLLPVRLFSPRSLLVCGDGLGDFSFFPACGLRFRSSLQVVLAFSRILSSESEDPVTRINSL